MLEKRLHINLQDNSDSDMEMQMNQRVKELEEENNILWNQVAVLTNKLNEERGLREEAEDSCRKAKSILDKVRCLRVQVRKEMKEQNRLNRKLMEQEKELRRELERQTHLASQAEEELKDLYVFHRKMKQKYHTELRTLKMLNARLDQQLHLKLQNVEEDEEEEEEEEEGCWFILWDTMTESWCWYLLVTLVI